MFIKRSGDSYTDKMATAERGNPVIKSLKETGQMVLSTAFTELKRATGYAVSHIAAPFVAAFRRERK